MDGPLSYAKVDINSFDPPVTLSQDVEHRTLLFSNAGIGTATD